MEARDSIETISGVEVLGAEAVVAEPTAENAGGNQTVESRGDSVNAGGNTEGYAQSSYSQGGYIPSSYVKPAEGEWKGFPYLMAWQEGSEGDSIVAEAEPVYGVVLTPPDKPEFLRRESSSDLSFITGSLFIIFFLICLRFRNNSKFIGALTRNLMEVKERSNLFDDTVRETSFVFLLNVMFCAGMGVILYRFLQWLPSPLFPLSPTLPEGAGMGLCMVVAVVYTIFMTVACLTTGNVFSDSVHAGIWLKGYSASQGILGFLYFPISLALVCYPGTGAGLLLVAAILFVLARFLFIWKGVRIFFTQSSSWVLFLYYLCSLEIVPLILSYAAASWLCSLQS